MKNNKKTIGTGGIFSKCKDPEKPRQWYAENPGLITTEYGSVFKFHNADNLNNKIFCNGAHFRKRQNILNPFRRNS